MSGDEREIEDIEQRLTEFFSAEAGRAKPSPAMWDRLSANLGEQHHPWRVLGLPVVLPATWRSRTCAVAATACVALAATLLAVFWPFGESLTPGQAVAEAYERMQTVGSFKLVATQTMKTLLGKSMCGSSCRPDALEGIEETDCVQVGSARLCTLTRAATGEKVGQSASVGGVRTTVWRYSGPNAYYYYSANTLDVPVPALEDMAKPHEVLVLDEGRWYTREPGGPKYPAWKKMSCEGADPGSCATISTSTPDYEPWYWKLMGAEGLEQFLAGLSDVRRLPDTDMGGVRVEHYSGHQNMSNDTGSQEVVDIWIGATDRLPRKVVREVITDRGSQERIEFEFSDFDEAFDLESYLTEPPYGLVDEVGQFTTYTSLVEACSSVDHSVYEPAYLPGSLAAVATEVSCGPETASQTCSGSVYTRFVGALGPDECPGCQDLYRNRSVVLWQGPVDDGIYPLPDEDLLSDEVEHGTVDMQGVRGRWIKGPWQMPSPDHLPRFEDTLVLYWTSGDMTFRLESELLNLDQMVKIASSLEKLCP